MNRRGFLSLVSAVSATAVLDPEKLLWQRGAKTISIPSASNAAVQAYVEATHRQAMETFSRYIDAIANIPDPRAGALVYSIGIPRNKDLVSDLLQIPYYQVRESGFYFGVARAPRAVS